MLEDKLIEKSKECFTMAIEIYNKPTIKYRVEGFSLFICNAWELMLKSYLIKRDGMSSIYYKDNPNRTISLETCLRKIFTNDKTPLRVNLEKIIELRNTSTHFITIYYKDNPNRTISLETCLRKIFTNDKTPLRVNLEKIIELRNTSTHFITEEYEMVYIPLFQACVLNFVEKMNEFHNVDMTEIIPQNFLTLVVSMKALDEERIKAKYPEEIAHKLIDNKNKLQPMIDENNQGFAIKVEHYHYLTKKKSEATSFVKVDNNADATVKIIKQIQDVNDTHKYTMKNACKEINNRLCKRGLEITINKYNFDLFNKVYGIKENPKYCYVHKQFAQPCKEINNRLCKRGLEITINKYNFDLFNKVYGIKENPKYCYVHKQFAQPRYTYSIQAIELITEEIKKDPDNIIENLKKSTKKTNPRGKGILGFKPTLIREPSLYPSRVSMYIYILSLKVKKINIIIK